MRLDWLIGHRHQWVAVSVRPMLSQMLANPLYGARNCDGTPANIGRPQPVTLVLVRCSCGKVSTSRLRGHWTLAEVRGMPDQPPAGGAT